jgi:pyruvate kinase
MRKTKIVCTIGPATESEEMLTKMMNAGMNVARINFSHGGYEENEEKIATIKKVREKLNIPVALMLDTKGPEIRTGVLESGNEKVTINEGDTFTFVNEDIIGNETKTSISYKNLYQDVKKGSRILVDDGAIEFEVIEVKGKDVVCKAVNTAKLGSRKTVNVPGLKLNLPALSEKDIKDITDGIKADFDYIAASFVRRASDVQEIRDLLNANGGENVKIISKIESQEGIDNFDEILALSDGIMVARGDMGVEIPMEQVPIVQKHFIKSCIEAGKPVITATQMLESMISNPRATRAEVSDVANAIFDITGAIMLSGESAMGKYPVECVNTMCKISNSVEANIKYSKRATRRDEEFEDTNFEFNLCHSISNTARDMKTDAIFAYTLTGDTARMLSSFLPECPIYALTTNKKTYEQLSLVWNVTPILVNGKENPNDVIEEGIQQAKQKGYVQKGDIVAIAGGASILSNHGDGEKTMNKTTGGILQI